MEPSVLRRLKETIVLRAQNISNFLSKTPPETVKLRIGPADQNALQKELAVLNNTLQKAEGNTIGLCEVCHEYIETSRLEMDYTACVCLEHLSGEERTRLENDLELSKKVQQALLPHVLPSILSIDIAAYSQPARIVGGDYFDFFRFKDGAHGIVIADVMGKGMPASMLMASLQASLRIIAPESSEPSEVVARLNHLFCHNVRLTNFVTLFLAKYDERARILTYCNAGHNPPLVLRNRGGIEPMAPTGAAIGLIEQTTFGQESVLLNAGDRLLMYTDGVVESQNQERELFGDKRLEQYLSGSSQKSAHQIIAGLKEVLQKFAGTNSPSDDTTVIAMRVTET